MATSQAMADVPQDTHVDTMAAAILVPTAAPIIKHCTETFKHVGIKYLYRIFFRTLLLLHRNTYVTLTYY